MIIRKDSKEFLISGSIVFNPPSTIHLRPNKVAQINPSTVKLKEKNIEYNDIFPDALDDSSKILANSINDLKTRVGSNDLFTTILLDIKWGKLLGIDILVDYNLYLE